MYQSVPTRTFASTSPHICSGVMSPDMVGKMLFDDMVKGFNRTTNEIRKVSVGGNAHRRREDEAG